MEIRDACHHKKSGSPGDQDRLVTIESLAPHTAVAKPDATHFSATV